MGPVADLGGVTGVPPPPTAQTFLNFMQFWGKFDKIVCWPPRGSAPPPTGNPGSAPGVRYCVDYEPNEIIRFKQKGSSIRHDQEIIISFSVPNG